MAEDAEEKEWLRLGLMVLEPRHHEVLALHWKGCTDAEIGEHLGVGANTARMRRNRAVASLSKKVFELQSKRLDEVIGE